MSKKAVRDKVKKGFQVILRVFKAKFSLFEMN